MWTYCFELLQLITETQDVLHINQESVVWYERY